MHKYYSAVVNAVSFLFVNHHGNIVANHYLYVVAQAASKILAKTKICSNRIMNWGKIF